MCQREFSFLSGSDDILPCHMLNSSQGYRTTYYLHLFEVCISLNFTLTKKRLVLELHTNFMLNNKEPQGAYFHYVISLKILPFCMPPHRALKSLKISSWFSRFSSQPPDPIERSLRSRHLVVFHRVSHKSYSPRSSFHDLAF